MFRISVLTLVVFWGCAHLNAADGAGGIACGVTLELDYIASVKIEFDAKDVPVLPGDGSSHKNERAPATLTLIDETSNTTPFVLAVWTKPGIDRSKLRLIVADGKDAIVDVLQFKAQFSERDDGELATFFGSLTKECTSTCSIHVVQMLGSKGFCEPFVYTKDGAGNHVMHTESGLQGSTNGTPTFPTR